MKRFPAASSHRTSSQSSQRLTLSHGFPPGNGNRLSGRSVDTRFARAGSGRAQEGEHPRRNHGDLRCLWVFWGFPGSLFLLEETIKKPGIDLCGAKIRVAQDPPKQGNVGLDAAHEILIQRTG